MTCAPLSRAQPKKIYALFNSSQPAATATCCDREFSIFQVQAHSLRLQGRETLSLCIFFLGKQAEENSKGLYFEILVDCIRIQAVRRPEWQPTGIRLLEQCKLRLVFFENKFCKNQRVI